MGLNCGCPAGAHLEDLVINDCKETLGQIQKIIIQRTNGDDGTPNVITDITKKATMTPLLTAADGTKIVISPYIQGPTTTPGAARTWGSDNEVLGGIPIIIGRESTSFEGNIYQEAQKTIKTLKSYMCEKISVYLIDENGNIGCLADDPDDPTEYRGIPVEGFFVSDKNLGGLSQPDGNAIQWNFYPNWSDDLVIVKQSAMDYNPLTDLVNGKSVGA